MLDNMKGELRIFTKEVEISKGKTKIMFTAAIGSKKQEDESYINAYVPVNFSLALKKEIAKNALHDEPYFDLIIKDAWLSAYKNKDGHVLPLLFVNKATPVLDEKPKKATKAKAKVKQEEMQEIDDEDLPF